MSTGLPAIYRVQDAAKALDVTVAWMERKAKARAIPVRIIGGRYAWTEDDLAQIVAASLQEPAAPTAPRPRKPRATAVSGPPAAPVLTARKRRR
ncbi:hypothetical protein [Nocardiopsis ganjiahuensis]|uniref:hypothetical protein n=1 Tax=Nocardiopsis ganjiahuensis TaxID=239984 RepID=UPI000349F4EA|nr:hypothetical protein [Nocardiopsis ganjiahuensis]